MTGFAGVDLGVDLRAVVGPSGFADPPATAHATGSGKHERHGFGGLLGNDFHTDVHRGRRPLEFDRIRDLIDGRDERYRHFARLLRRDRVVGVHLVNRDVPLDTAISVLEAVDRHCDVVGVVLLDFDDPLGADPVAAGVWVPGYVGLLPFTDVNSTSRWRR